MVWVVIVMSNIKFFYSIYFYPLWCGIQAVYSSWVYSNCGLGVAPGGGHYPILTYLLWSKLMFSQACMSPRRGVSPHGSQHPPLDTTPSMSDRLFRLGLAESQVDSSLDGNIKIEVLKSNSNFLFPVYVPAFWKRQRRLPRWLFG